MGNRRLQQTQVRLMQLPVRAQRLYAQYEKDAAPSGISTDDEDDSVFLSQIGCHNKHIIYSPTFLVT